MEGEVDQHDKHVHISGNALALAVVSLAGIILTFVFPGAQAQNAIQIGSCGGLAAILLRGLGKADAVVKAAVHLAERLAENTPPDDGVEAPLAPVVPLPSQRSEIS